MARQMALAANRIRTHILRAAAPEDIALITGVTRGAVYRHFGNKRNSVEEWGRA